MHDGLAVLVPPNSSFLKADRMNSNVTSKAALLCIDMQRDFLLPSSPLQVKGGLAVVDNVKSAIEKARAHGLHIFFVVRDHDEHGVDIEWTRRHLLTDAFASKEGRTTGCTVTGTAGAQLIDGLTVRSNERVVLKRRFSAFFATNLDLLLRRLGVNHIILCGVQTPNCIRATAVDGIGLDYKVTVLCDATASKSEAVQRSNLEDMKDMGIHIARVGDLFQQEKQLGNASIAPPSLFQSSLKALAAVI